MTEAELLSSLPEKITNFFKCQLSPLKIDRLENFEMCWDSMNMTNNHATHKEVSSKTSRDMTKFTHAYQQPYLTLTLGERHRPLRFRRALVMSDNCVKFDKD